MPNRAQKRQSLQNPTGLENKATALFWLFMIWGLLSRQNNDVLPHRSAPLDATAATRDPSFTHAKKKKIKYPPRPSLVHQYEKKRKENIPLSTRSAHSAPKQWQGKKGHHSQKQRMK